MYAGKSVYIPSTTWQVRLLHARSLFSNAVQLSVLLHIKLCESVLKYIGKSTRLPIRAVFFKRATSVDFDSINLA